MKKQKLLLGLILFVLGLIGILSMLTMDIPLPPEVAEILEDRFTPVQIKMVLMINPLLMLIVAVVIGTSLYQKVNLRVPLIEKLVGIENANLDTTSILKFGILGGVLAGFLISLVMFIFYPLLPSEFLELGESLKPSLAARFLYGGLTEEILLRFGVMTLVVWIASKVFSGTAPVVYWIGIVIAAVLFALGHFPVAFNISENPSMLLLAYIFIGNILGGLIFGWIYWKKGLEAAFLAHIFAHVVMVIAEPLLGWVGLGL